MMTLKNSLKVLPQYLLPQHLCSQWLGKLTHSPNKIIKNFIIQQLINIYGINMDDALESDPSVYPDVNAFFTRALKPDARSFPNQVDAIACPADGQISQLGRIAQGQIFQAKGKQFSACALLGGDEQRSAVFNQGQFATIYLSPKDYHRLHMPVTGTLTEMIHIPGRLFSVNTTTTNTVPNLFARNERVCCFFDTEAGPMVLVLVGAIFVSSIETVWQGVITPPTKNSLQHWDYRQQPLTLVQGQEMGRFNMGSTIIVLFADDKIRFENTLKAGAQVRLGRTMGTFARDVT
jgi:phosphatidylserine decarboxylase